jgi:hypothetical protein
MANSQGGCDFCCRVGGSNPRRYILVSPLVMIRQFLACVLFGINFGPAFFGLVTHYTYFSSASAEGATICATGLCGVYLTEGFVALAKRWSSNPQLPWKKP